MATRGTACSGTFMLASFFSPGGLVSLLMHSVLGQFYAPSDSMVVSWDGIKLTFGFDRISG